MIGAMMDITERKQAETALLEANEKMARSLSELELRNQEIIVLNEMSDLLQASHSEKEAHSIIANAAKRLFPGTSGALYLFNTERTLVVAAAPWGNPPPHTQVFAHPMTVGRCDAARLINYMGRMTSRPVSTSRSRCLRLPTVCQWWHTAKSWGFCICSPYPKNI
jgi:hypothetical protein